MGRYRNLKVLLNGQCIGEVAHNESKTFQVKPGEYNLQVAMDWKKSRSMLVPIAANQSINFKAVVPGGESFINTFLSIIGGRMPFFELERSQQPSGSGSVPQSGKLKFFMSSSSAEAKKNPGFDPIILQHGRFASYFEREIVIPGLDISIYINHTAIPEGFLLIGISLETMFNDLLLGRDKEFLPVARHKYKSFDIAFSRFEDLQRSHPKPGIPWLGIDKDPNDGAEITIICAMQPIDPAITSNPEALLLEIKSPTIRTTSEVVINLGIDILQETSDPIDPIRDTLKFKQYELIEEIKDPKKVIRAISVELSKKWGGELLQMAEVDIFDKYADKIHEKLGDTIFNYIDNHIHGRTTSSGIKPFELAKKLYDISK